MPVITLTSDFGVKEYMIASVKGSILKELPDARLIDITHGIAPFDIAEAAFVTRNVYPNFPEDTVHIISVSTLPNERTKLLAARIDGQYFLAADNGILSLILAELRPEKMVQITIGKYNEYSTFPTKEIFVPVACHLVRGGTLEVIGDPTNEYKELNLIRPIVQSDNVLRGSVIYIDNYGNVITNIHQKMFNEVRRGRNFEIQVRNLRFKKILKNYSEVVSDFDKEVESHGKELVLFNSTGFLEIALYKSNPKTFGSASSLMGLKKGDTISIEFS